MSQGAARYRYWKIALQVAMVIGGLHDLQRSSALVPGPDLQQRFAVHRRHKLCHVYCPGVLCRMDPSRPVWQGSGADRDGMTR